MTPPPATLRVLFPTVFVPAAIYGVGQGAAAPVIALTARELGASVGVAGLVVALSGLGLLLGDLPAGRIVARFGERLSIIGGSVIGTVGVGLCLSAWSVWVLALGVTLTGFSNAVWGLARQAYLAEAVPVDRRARAMSAMAGMMRLGFLVGPFLGAGVIVLVGTHGGFVVQLAAVIVAGTLMSRLPDPPHPGHDGAAPASTTAVMREHRRLLLTLGAGSLLMGATRAARDAVLPLTAEQIGLSAATASLIFGVGAAIDVACSYPAGQLMDRIGRRFVAVSSLLVMTLAYLLLPLAASVGTLLAVALVMGLGNGLGSGVIMTIGADVAPPPVRAQFLSAWRLTHDAGMFAGPLLIGVLATVATLGSAVLALAGTAALGAAVLARFIPVYVQRPGPKVTTTCPSAPGEA